MLRIVQDHTCFDSQRLRWLLLEASCCCESLRLYPLRILTGNKRAACFNTITITPAAGSHTTSFGTAPPGSSRRKRCKTSGRCPLSDEQGVRDAKHHPRKGRSSRREERLLRGWRVCFCIALTVRTEPRSHATTADRSPGFSYVNRASGQVLQRALRFTALPFTDRY